MSKEDRRAIALKDVAVWFETYKTPTLVKEFEQKNPGLTGKEKEKQLKDFLDRERQTELFVSEVQIDLKLGLDTWKLSTGLSLMK
jgi:hypothetical protein